MFKAKGKVVSLLTACLTMLFALVLGCAALFAPTPITTASAESATYEKVTSAPADSDWSGEYLIVYETGNVAFNGSLATLDAANNNVAVTISNNKITLDDTKAFTIAKSGSNYTIQSKSEYYIGQASNANGLKSSTAPTYTNTLSINTDGSVNIVSSGGAYLRYNATSGFLGGEEDTDGFGNPNPNPTNFQG